MHYMKSAYAILYMLDTKTVSCLMVIMAVKKNRTENGHKDKYPKYKKKKEEEHFTI